MESQPQYRANASSPSGEIFTGVVAGSVSVVSKSIVILDDIFSNLPRNLAILGGVLLLETFVIFSLGFAAGSWYSRR